MNSLMYGKGGYQMKKTHPNLYLVVGIFAIVVNIVLGQFIVFHNSFIDFAQGFLSALGIFFCVIGLFDQHNRMCKRRSS